LVSWENSKGMAQELDFFRFLRNPIVFLDPRRAGPGRPQIGIRLHRLGLTSTRHPLDRSPSNTLKIYPARLLWRVLRLSSRAGLRGPKLDASL
jgi:hypothetical protein